MMHRFAFPIIRSSVIGDEVTRPTAPTGVVPYWSSHLDGAQSEVIVPGPHGSCALPQTIDELDRILKLHLGKSATKRQQQTASIARAPNSVSP